MTNTPEETIDPVILGAVNLLDPDCEPTDEQLRRLCASMMADVRISNERMKENLRLQMERDLAAAQEYIKRPVPPLFKNDKTND